MGKTADLLRKGIKIFTGILLLLFDAALIVSFVLEFKKVRWLEGHGLIFLYGVAAFVLTSLFSRGRPFLYVFAHELSHAIASFMTGSKVHSIYVSGTGGTTKTEKSNLLILLFPYVFPFFSVLVMLLYWALGWAGDVYRIQPYFYFLMGFTLTYHLCLTVYFIFKGQSDIRKAEPILALGLVGFLNVVILTVMVGALFPDVSVMRLLARGLWFFKELMS